jgi:hypothetical protein
VVVVRLKEEGRAGGYEKGKPRDQKEEKRKKAGSVAICSNYIRLRALVAFHHRRPLAKGGGLKKQAGEMGILQLPCYQILGRMS